MAKQIDPQSKSQVLAKPKMAVVTTYDDLCGIAGYSRCLEAQFKDCFDIEIIDLNQTILRKSSRRVGDIYIDDLCKRLAHYPVVNVQFESSLLGTNIFRIVDRFDRIVKASRSLIFTMHTVVSIVPASQVGKKSNQIRMVFSKWLKARLSMLSVRERIYKRLKTLASARRACFIVHSYRDQKYLEEVVKLKNVYLHPLTYFDESDFPTISKVQGRQPFAALSGLNSDHKILGVFGFIGPYKGIDVAIKALQFLPDEFHLAVFGGVHPAIARSGPLDHPHIEKLKQLTLDQKVQSRVHFVGPLSEEDFVIALRACDQSLFPYLENGNSTSGPAAMAIDLGHKIIASRNELFLEMSRFYSSSIEFFEMGNAQDLANKILLAKAGSEKNLSFNTQTNRATYLEAYNSLGGA